jgi:hypothetical protein
MTITLQDLQVLNEKATQDLWRSDCILPPEHATRLHTIRTADDPPTRIVADGLYERDGVFIAALVNYYRSGALQRLAELADRYVDMRDNDRSLEYADHTADRLNGRPTNLDAAIDSARAPSVKEEGHD